MFWRKGFVSVHSRAYNGRELDGAESGKLVLVEENRWICRSSAVLEEIQGSGPYSKRCRGEVRGRAGVVPVGVANDDVVNVLGRVEEHAVARAAGGISDSVAQALGAVGLGDERPPDVELCLLSGRVVQVALDAEVEDEIGDAAVWRCVADEE